MINFLRVVTGSRNVYNDGGSGTNSFFNIGGIRIEGSSTSILIILALALIISIIVFSCVVKTRKIPKTRFFNWLKEFLNFRSILIENILKFIYLFLATLLTLISIYAIKENVLAFLVLFIVGNLALRIVFEFSLMLIVIWKNTSDISASANSIRSVVAPNKLEQRIEQKQEIKKQ